MEEIRIEAMGQDCQLHEDPGMVIGSSNDMMFELRANAGCGSMTLAMDNNMKIFHLILCSLFVENDFDANEVQCLK
jgi:hypothetical protein